MLNLHPRPRFITFDCYGTLVQWHGALHLKVCQELGIRAVWINRLGKTLHPEWTPAAVLSNLTGLPEILA